MNRISYIDKERQSIQDLKVCILKFNTFDFEYSIEEINTNDFSNKELIEFKSQSFISNGWCIFSKNSSRKSPHDFQKHKIYWNPFRFSIEDLFNIIFREYLSPNKNSDKVSRKRSEDLIKSLKLINRQRKIDFLI